MASQIVPYWLDEKDWLCIVEFLPEDDPEDRAHGAEVIGYYLGYAHLTDTRMLALVGDPVGHAYEMLFSFSSPEGKQEFRSKRDIDFAKGVRLVAALVGCSK